MLFFDEITTCTRRGKKIICASMQRRKPPEMQGHDQPGVMVKKLRLSSLKSYY